MSATAVVLLLQLASHVPPRAVDHVSRIEVVTDYGASSGDRSIVYRSGQHVRVDGMQYGRIRGSSYRDLARGLVVSTAVDADGALLTVTIAPPYNQSRRLPPTGRRDRVIGEECAIRRVADERMGSNYELCETEDGIPLSYAFWYPRDGDRIVMYERATAVERRPVRPEEVLPPRDLLARVSAAPASAAAPAAQAVPDHEVEMVADDPADGSYVQRHHGRHFSERRSSPEGRSLRTGNGALSFSYREDPAGRPLSLEITRGGATRLDRRIRLELRWEPVLGRPPEHVLGETCTWQDNAAVRSTDRHHYCRTADGITLKTEAWFHWTGHTQRFTARRLSRAPLRDEDFALPGHVLQWGHWGITPAP
ncbi:MAG TPA: hypothetical protein VMG08_19965 [Allosphingosinicella sp.]|nr:hypothetical protein [Allosphingosinicella sp.]